MSYPLTPFLQICLFTKAFSSSNQFQLDAEMLSDSLNRLNANLDPKSLNSKTNSEVLLELEVQLFYSN